MFSWEAFMDRWASQILVGSIMLLVALASYGIGIFFTTLKFQRHIRLHHEAISKANIERWKAEKERAIKLYDELRESHHKLRGQYHAAQIMVSKALEALAL